MIEHIIITSLSGAVSASHNPNTEQKVWITAVDPADKSKVLNMKRRFGTAGIKHFPQFFEDIEDHSPDRSHLTEAMIEERGPQMQHINSIISFIEPFVASKQNYKLGINCYAGLCRSTAIGIVVWVLQGKTPEEALELILKARPVAWPNQRVLRLASVRLEKDLTTAVADWKASQLGKLIV